MFSIRQTILLIIFMITLYVSYHHYFPESKFWKYQPVTRKGLEIEGDIVNNPLSSKHLSVINKNKFEKVEKITDLVKLLDNNYFYGVKYPEKYLEWELTNGESWFIRESGKVIGAISKIPLTISINKKDIQFMYVDHLTVIKDQRGKGIATKLISKGVQIGVDKNIPRFIFRIEQKPLPYPYLCKLSNYYGKLPEKQILQEKINTHKFINDNTNVYMFWKQWIEKHKFAMIMNNKQFFKYAKFSDIVTTVYFEKDEKIVGLFIGLKTIFKGDPVIEIVFIHCDKIAEKQMIKTISSLNCKWISMHNYSDQIKWIKLLKLKRSHDLYIHLYNYHHPKIDPIDLHFGMG